MPSTVISWKMAVANSIDPFGRLGASGADQLGAEQLAGDGVAGDADVDGLGAGIRHLRRHSGLSLGDAREHAASPRLRRYIDYG